MPTYSAPIFAVAAAAIGLCSACSSLPTAFPRFEDAQAQPALVVGTIDRDRYLDPFQECESPDAICMDPPPLLLTVTISRTVYGPELKGRRHVATTSHYGRGTHAPGSGDLSLLPVKVHGQDLVLPRYAGASLERTSTGDLAVPDWGTFPIWWLPCSAMELREPIEFTSSAARLVDDLDVSKIGSLVRNAGKKALPLFGLRLTRIAEHLATLNPNVSEMKCESLPR
jgi:hypothetical protein